MSKYNDYGEFLQEVVNTANRKSDIPLYRLYGVENDTVGMILSVLGVGWIPFAAMTSLFGLALVAFLAALAVFIITPVGVVVIAALVLWGGKNAIRILYDNKALPIAIKTIGDKYKDRFDSHMEECAYIDGLMDEAANELIREANH